MNPELIERPRDIAIHKMIDEHMSEILNDHSRSRLAILLLGVAIGALLGCLWREIYEWIF